MSQKKKEFYFATDNCPVRDVLDRIGDKWSMLVLLVLEDAGVMRFNELHGAIENISQKMLTVTLKSLEADGLIKRTVYAQIPPKVEYALTVRGESLMPHLHSLVGWAKKNLTKIVVAREQFAKENAA